MVGVTPVECYTRAPTNVYWSLGSAVMWMSVIVMCVYNYKILFLFNVTDYSRFLKSVFFRPPYLASLLLVPLLLTPH